jgi:hypothetical protein
MIDEVTGERVEDTGMLVHTEHTLFAKQDQPDLAEPETEFDEETTYITEEEAAELGLLDELAEQISPVELASISDEIHNHTVITNPELATSIASVDLGDSAADITVQFLAHKVFNGDITSTEAFEEAVNSGLPPEALASSFKRLQSYFK